MKLQNFLCNTNLHHKWKRLDGDGEADYEECTECGTRRIFNLNVGSYCFYRRQWEDRRKAFMNREKYKK